MLDLGVKYALIRIRGVDFAENDFIDTVRNTDGIFLYVFLSFSLLWKSRDLI